MDGRHPETAVAEMERLLAANGFDPLEDGMWILGDESLGAIPVPVGLVVGWIDIAWAGGAHTPVFELRGVRHLPTALAEMRLRGDLAELREEHETALSECRSCSRRLVPGRMHEAHVCQGCAERHLGVVH